MTSRRMSFATVFLAVFIFVTILGNSQLESHNHRLKQNGPFSEHGKLCDALWRPHLTEPLEECDLLRNRCTAKEFTCIKRNCCPSKAVVCTMSIDSGHELQLDEHFGRYAFSEQLNACIKFSYFGNAGNFNNFLTHRDCVRYCVGYRNATAGEKKRL